LTTIPVNLRAKSDTRYDIYLASGLLGGIGGKIKASIESAQTVAVVTDDNVKALYLQPLMESIKQEGFRPVSFSIPPGEASKSAEMYLTLLNWLAENKLTRSDAVVALGGGVVGDLAGFTAATYLRGITFVQIPTTLLAMVDSSVGGKTGIDLPAGKNLTGAFYQPSMVLCDLDVLTTLSPEVFGDGCAEVIKYGMIRHVSLLEKLLSAPVHQQLAEVIDICVSIKRDIVQEDEFDVGERQLLNFGHTIGHAIEKLSGYEVSHGRAVAAGMSIITRAAVRKNLCPPQCQTVLERLLADFNLPNRTDYSPKALYEAALNDKKRSGGTITEIVPSAFGESVLRKMPVTELLEWIELGLEP
jgi:3-dehydroquinate synthase